MKPSKSPEKLNIALGQINPTVGDFDGNRKKICGAIASAEAKGLDWIIFPELSICGYPVWDLANKTSFVRAGLKSLDQIVQFTKGKKIRVVVGFIDLGGTSDRKNYNALALIQNGKILQRQYKTLLPTYDVFLEQIFFKQGKEQKTFSTDGLSFGLTICEDIWEEQYSVKPVQMLAKKGAKVIINISASPYHKEQHLKRQAVVLRQARKYGVWIVYVNQVGGQDDLIFDGRSFVCDNKGRLRYQAEPFREGVFRVPLSPKPSRVEQIDVVRDTYEALKLGLRDYVRKNGFKKVVLGLSGGIDSALVACLAADALGPQSVVGVAMPGPFSSSQSLRDAKALAENLRIGFRTKSIVSAYEKFMNETEKSGNQITTAMENLQARLRGIRLMYISNHEGVLLMTTGNKSELAMGYSTLYGDMCGGLSVIGDVYKTDVYRLSKYRNSVSKVIPDAIMKRSPTAELRPNQKDSDSLPPYSVLDAILYLYIEKNYGSNEIIKKLRNKKVSHELIRRVLSAVDHNEYKRRQLPPALRITEKAWFGRRMPITNLFRE